MNKNYSFKMLKEFAMKARYEEAEPLTPEDDALLTEILLAIGPPTEEETERLMRRLKDSYSTASNSKEVNIKVGKSRATVRNGLWRSEDKELLDRLEEETISLEKIIEFPAATRDFEIAQFVTEKLSGEILV